MKLESRSQIQFLSEKLSFHLSTVNRNLYKKIILILVTLDFHQGIEEALFQKTKGILDEIYLGVSNNDVFKLIFSVHL